MRKLLRLFGIQKPHEWYGHNVRRGAAADVFAAAGVDTMIERGGWENLSGSRPYVPSDEIAAGMLAQTLIDDSSPEN